MRTSFNHAENDIHISRSCIQSIHVYDVAKFGVSTDDLASYSLLYML